MSRLRSIIAVVLIYCGTTAAAVGLTVASRIAAGDSHHGVEAVPAFLMLGICAGVTAISARLWERWREALAACLVLQGIFLVSVSRQAPSGGPSVALSRDYLIPAALLGAAGIVVFVWCRQRRG